MTPMWVGDSHFSGFFSLPSLFLYLFFYSVFLTILLRPPLFLLLRRDRVSPPEKFSKFYIAVDKLIGLPSKLNDDDGQFFKKI